MLRTGSGLGAGARRGCRGRSSRRCRHPEAAPGRLHGLAVLRSHPAGPKSLEAEPEPAPARIVWCGSGRAGLCGRKMTCGIKLYNPKMGSKAGMFIPALRSAGCKRESSTKLAHRKEKSVLQI